MLHPSPRPRFTRVGRTMSFLICVPLLLAAMAFGAIYANEASGPRLVCLMYHRFVSEREFQALRGKDRLYAISVDRFEQHLRLLRDLGYHSVSLEDALAFARGEKNLPEKAVLITIDDGYRCALTRAEPLLRAYGHRAALFATTNPRAKIFAPANHRPLSAADLRRLDAGVVEVLAHGATHRPLRDLPDAEICAELREPRASLEHALGHPVRAMAVPGNWYDRRVLGFAREAGYEAVFTSDPGSIRPGGDPFQLPRWNVGGDTSARRLADMLGPAAMARRRFAWGLSHRPRELLGEAIGAPVARVLAGFSAMAFQWPRASGLTLAGALAALIGAALRTRRGARSPGVQPST